MFFIYDILSFKKISPKKSEPNNLWKSSHRRNHFRPPLSLPHLGFFWMKGINQSPISWACTRSLCLDTRFIRGLLSLEIARRVNYRDCQVGVGERQISTEEGASVRPRRGSRRFRKRSLGRVRFHEAVIPTKPGKPRRDHLTGKSHSEKSCEGGQQFRHLDEASQRVNPIDL